MSKATELDQLAVLSLLQDDEWHPASEVIAVIGCGRNLRHNVELAIFQAELIQFKSVSAQEFLRILRAQGVRGISFQLLKITAQGKQRLKELQQSGLKAE